MPHFLNFLGDVTLRFVPIENAVNMDGAKENVISFSYDTVLLATTKTGLQNLIDIVTGFFAECGLQANPSKSQTLTIESIPGKKKTVVTV